MSQVQPQASWETHNLPPLRNRVGALGFTLSLLGILVLITLTILYACDVELVTDNSAWTLIALGAFSPLGLFISAAGVFRMPKTLATVGIVFGLLGTLYLAGAGSLLLAEEWDLFTPQAEKEKRRAERTDEAVRKATAIIQKYVDDKRVAPSDEEGTRLIGGRKDGWGRPLQYLQGEGRKFQVISGGPDREFGNADDVTNESLKLVKPDPMEEFLDDMFR